jgi:hypothetical protein
MKKKLWIFLFIVLGCRQEPSPTKTPVPSAVPKNIDDLDTSNPLVRYMRNPPKVPAADFFDFQVKDVKGPYSPEQLINFFAEFPRQKKMLKCYKAASINGIVTMDVSMGVSDYRVLTLETKGDSAILNDCIAKEMTPYMMPPPKQGKATFKLVFTPKTKLEDTDT